MTVELALRDVHAGYGPVEVLHGVTMAFPRSALTAVLGANGAGKTTALGVLAGLVRARSGTVEWAGRDASRLSAYERAHAGLVLVPDRRGVFTELTVRDNLEVFAGRGGSLRPAFDAFPVLRERLQQPAGSLSGGEQQMLAMSRALLRRPRVLLLDEISLGLAPRVVAQLFDVVRGLADGETTVVMVEQYTSPALRMAQVVYVLDRGEVAFAGEPVELAGASRTRSSR